MPVGASVAAGAVGAVGSAAAAVAPFASALAPTVGSLISGATGTSGQSAGATAVQQANAANNQVAASVYQNSQTNFQPYVTNGGAASGALAGLEGIGTPQQVGSANSAFNNYKNSTNYQFALGQGEDAIDYGNATQYDSGARQKALVNYAEGTAGNTLGQYEGLLQNQQGVGEQATSALGQIGGQYAAQIASNNNIGAGATRAADINNGITNGSSFSGLAAAAGKSVPGALSGVSSFLGSGLQGVANQGALNGVDFVSNLANAI